MGFPSKYEAMSSVTDAVLRQLGFTSLTNFEECYNGYGSFDLKEFVDFDENFFENNSLELFAKNISENNKPSIGVALLSSETVSEKGSSKGNRQYKNSVFDTGHLLAYMLIGGLGDEKFNSRKTNLENVFPQTRWSNGRGFCHPNTSYGNHQRSYEQLIKSSICRTKDTNSNYRVYYKIRLIYDGAETVPRGVHIQAISNDRSLLDKINVFIPNVQYGKDTGLDYSCWDRNMK